MSGYSGTLHVDTYTQTQTQSNIPYLFPTHIHICLCESKCVKKYTKYFMHISCADKKRNIAENLNTMGTKSSCPR